MNLSPRWVDHLAAAGHDTVHWSNVGRPDATDAEIMAHATSSGMAILAASGGTAPSVVTIRADNLAVDKVGESVLVALRQFERELSEGALLIVQPHRTRVRPLPLRPDQ